MSITNRPYESTLGRALELWRSGFKAPIALVRELVDEQGYTLERVLEMEAQHLRNQP